MNPTKSTYDNCACTPNRFLSNLMLLALRASEVPKGNFLVYFWASLEKSRQVGTPEILNCRATGS